MLGNIGFDLFWVERVETANVNLGRDERLVGGLSIVAIAVGIIGSVVIVDLAGFLSKVIDK